MQQFSVFKKAEYFLAYPGIKVTKRIFDMQQ